MCPSPGSGQSVGVYLHARAQAVLECLNQSTTNNPFKGGDKVLGRVTLLVPSGRTEQDVVCAAFMALTKVCAWRDILECAV